MYVSTVRFLLSVFSTTPFTAAKGQTITVTGPSQFWDFQSFTNNHDVKIYDVGVVIHPELSSEVYAAPIVLQHMN